MKAIIWFTNNLRTLDHPLLHKACKEATTVEALYCYDPSLFKEDIKGDVKIGPYRKKFLIESLLDLQEQLERLHIPLHILVGKPEKEIPTLLENIGATDLFYQKNWHEEERQTEKAVRENLNKQLSLHSAYDQFLITPSELPFEVSELPRVFTVFRKQIEKQCSIAAPLPIPKAIDQNIKAKVSQEWETICKEVASIKNDPRTAFPFKGGSQSGLDRIHSYFWETDHVAVYKKTRNGMIGTSYSTKFSPWLANGSVSARTIYQMLKQYETDRTSNESTYWVFFELLWREFFKYVGLKHGNLLFKSGGILKKEFAQGQDNNLFLKWKEGNTSNSFINAHMKELSKTGWMSNRGRQNVASYWSKSLGQDWRRGAAYFESMLLDYDVDSNWGNWMYTSGVGNDPRDRIFDPNRQAKMYDPHGTFQKKWLQESLF
jgi:deoxyribodipyrimidine photo-lyase